MTAAAAAVYITRSTDLQCLALKQRSKFQTWRSIKVHHLSIDLCGVAGRINNKWNGKLEIRSLTTVHVYRLRFLQKQQLQRMTYKWQFNLWLLMLQLIPLLKISCLILHEVFILMNNTQLKCTNSVVTSHFHIPLQQYGSINLCVVDCNAIQQIMNQSRTKTHVQSVILLRKLWLAYWLTGV